jgi:hypothetical protein
MPKTQLSLSDSLTNCFQFDVQDLSAVHATYAFGMFLSPTSHFFAYCLHNVHYLYILDLTQLYSIYIKRNY